MRSMTASSKSSRLKYSGFWSSAIGSPWAAAAAELVQDGMTVLLDSGSTTFWTAKALTRPRDLTVVTNSIEVAREVLGRNNNNRLFFAGGEIDADHRAAYGAEALSMAQGFVPDIAFLSIGAIDPKRGFLDFHVDEARFKRALLAVARRLVIVADASKFDRAGAILTARLDQVQDLVVDRPPPPAAAVALEGAGVSVHVAAPPPD